MTPRSTSPSVSTQAAPIPPFFTTRRRLEDAQLALEARGRTREELEATIAQAQHLLDLAKKSLAEE